MHLIIFPKSLIFPSIYPDIPTVSFDVIGSKFSLVSVSIQPGEGTVSLLHSFNIVPFIFSPICPFLITIAMLLIVMPFSCIGSAILVEIYTLSLCFIVDPLSLIDIAACLNESSLTVGHIVRPVAFIKGAILPYLTAFALSFAIFPLPIVYGSIFKFDWRFCFVRECLSEVELSQFKVSIFDRFWAYLCKLFENEIVSLGVFRCWKESHSFVMSDIFTSFTISHF